MISKCLNIFDTYFEEVVAATMLAFLVLLLCLQVFMRFVLHQAFSWNEELSRFVFVWFCYLAGSLGVQRQGHIRVSTFVDMIKNVKIKTIAVVISDAIWLVFNIFVVFLGFELLHLMSRFPNTSPVMGINMVWIYSIVPFSFILMSFRLLQLYYRKIMKFIQNRGR